MSEKNLRAVGDRIEALLQDLQGSADPRAGEQAREVVRLLMELYGSTLDRMLEIVATSPQGGGAILEQLAADDLVASVLVLHGLHPEDLETRIRRALDKVRPYLGSHGGDVQLIGVEGGVARLRLEGTCHGCGSSAVTMKLAVEGAILEAAPEVQKIEVDGMEPPPPVSPLLQIKVRKNGAAESREVGWTALDSPPVLNPGGMARIDLAGTRLVLCRVGDDLFAYRVACPSCGGDLGKGALAESLLSCGACGRRFDVRLAGHCVDSADLHLDPLPLLSESGGVKIALPALHGG